MNLNEITQLMGGVDQMAKSIGLTKVRMRQLLREEDQTRLLLKYLPEIHECTKLPIDEIYHAIVAESL